MRIACCLVVGLLWLGPTAARGVDGTVIVLSWDGLRADYPDRGGLPALERMQREGARAAALVPVFPSNTFPNHVSLATGAPVDRHGVVANHFTDPELGEFDYSPDARFIDAEPLWIAAERQGVRAASFFWVGSETDWHGARATYRVTPFSSGVPESEKVDRILEWLALPPAERPRLVMSWWHGADREGHRWGPDSERTTAALREQDAELARLLAGLDAREAWPHTTLFVVGDHGMIGVTEGIDAGAALEEAGIDATVHAAGGVALVALADPARTDDAVALLGAIEGVSAMRAEDVPEALRFRHPTRIGQVVAFTTPPRMLSRGSSSLDRWRRVSRLFNHAVGTHGFDPAVVPEMNSTLLALGRGVPKGAALGRVSSLDLAPTVAYLLGIDPPLQSEGVRIGEIGTIGGE